MAKIIFPKGTTDVQARNVQQALAPANSGHYIVTIEWFGDTAGWFGLEGYLSFGHNLTAKALLVWVTEEMKRQGIPGKARIAHMTR